MDGSGDRIGTYLPGTYRYIVCAVSWTPTAVSGRGPDGPPPCTRPSAGRAAGSRCAAWSGCSASGSAVSSSGGPALIWARGCARPTVRASPGCGRRSSRTAARGPANSSHPSGTVTLPNVSYAGSLPAVQPGTVVPALDAGAGDEVYPLTGSDKWVRDLIGVVGGTVALVGLLARGFFVARRRRRAPPADYLTQAVESADYPRRGDAPRAHAETTADRAALPGGKARPARGRGRGDGVGQRQVHPRCWPTSGPTPAGTGCSRWPAGS